MRLTLCLFFVLLSHVAQATCASTIGTLPGGVYTAHALRDEIAKVNVANAYVWVRLGRGSARWIEDVGMPLQYGFGTALDAGFRGFRSDLPMSPFRFRSVSLSLFHFFGGDEDHSLATLQNAGKRVGLYRTKDDGHLLSRTDGTGGFVVPVHGGFDVYAWEPDRRSGKLRITIVGIRTEDAYPEQIATMEFREYTGASWENVPDSLEPQIGPATLTKHYTSRGPFVRTVD